MVKKKQALVAQTTKDGENVQAQKKKKDKETLYIDRF
jgi:hypothetical protein